MNKRKFQRQQRAEQKKEKPPIFDLMEKAAQGNCVVCGSPETVGVDIHMIGDESVEEFGGVAGKVRTMIAALCAAHMPTDEDSEEEKERKMLESEAAAKKHINRQAREIAEQVEDYTCSFCGGDGDRLHPGFMSGYYITCPTCRENPTLFTDAGGMTMDEVWGIER